MADETIVFNLDAETKDLLAKLVIAREEIKKLGDKKNTEGLVQGLQEAHGTLGEIAEADSLGSLLSVAKEMGPVIATVAVAIAAVKTSFDMAEEAETIKSVNTQFELLTRNAGISSDALKEGLIGASGGLIAETELLKSANEKIAMMGDNAKRLPEILELARKSAVVMGTDSLTAFNNLSFAISTGNQRALKHAGIIVDTKKAYEDYAKSIGITAGELTKSGQQAAIMEAALEKGKTALAGISDQEKPLTNAMTRMKVSFTELKETITNIVGPAVSGFFSSIAEGAAKAAEVMGNQFKLAFGNPVDKAKAQISTLTDNIAVMQREIDSGRYQGQSLKLFQDDLEKSKAKLESLLEKQEESEQKLYHRKTMAAGQAQQGSTVDPNANKIDQEKVEKDHQAFVQEIAKMDQAHYQAQRAISQSEVQMQKIADAEIVVAKKEAAAQIAALKTNEHMNEAQKAQMKVAINQQMNDKIKAIEERALADRAKAYDNFGKHNNGVMDGIARAAIVSSKKASDAMKANGDLGKQTYTTLENTAVGAFEAMGKGAVTGQNEIGKVVLGGLGEIASNYGKTIFLANAFPPLGPDPAAMAGGAALMVLGGALGALGGGSSSSSSAASVSSGGAIDTGSSAASSTTSSAPLMSEAPAQKKTATIVVQGSYFETDQTRQRLMEMMRESTDFTDFSYKQIGQ